MFAHKIAIFPMSELPAFTTAAPFTLRVWVTYDEIKITIASDTSPHLPDVEVRNYSGTHTTTGVPSPTYAPIVFTWTHSSASCSVIPSFLW